MPDSSAATVSEARLLEIGRQRLAATDLDTRKLAEAHGLEDELIRAWSLSEYLFDSCRRFPDLLTDLITSGDLTRSYGPGEHLDLARSVIDDPSEEELTASLRIFRRREMVRIIWRDLARRAQFRETTGDLSRLAEACISITLDRLHEALAAEYGAPIGRHSKKPQRLCVLALGKLGGSELNLSSDVDLVFLYREQGFVRELGRASEEITNQEFFIRLARRLIAVLSEVRSDGFVFRVDMRLRPYGESGSLVLSRPAMEHYFEREGRDWERYAFIKARPVAGDLGEGRSFLEWLVPFVYRKYLDYGAIESLRDMKKLIDREVEDRELADDIKLGPGGIREIEFLVQSFQLMWGARDRRLRETNLLTALTVLAERGDLPVDVVARLETAYLFLRNAEHAIQAEADRQTQRLPQEDLSRERLANAMGFAGWFEFRAALDGHREFVTECYRRVMEPAGDPGVRADAREQMWERVWSEIARRDVTQFLEDSGFTDCAEVAASIGRLRRERDRDPSRTIEIERIDRLIPRILLLVSRERNPARTFGRVVSVIEEVLRRTTYLAFLLEHPASLERMVKLCGTSRWITDQLAKQPMLMYELGRRTGADEIPDKTQMREELRQRLDAAAAGDLEEQMELLRQFKNAHQMRIALMELSNLSSVMISSDQLTDLADVILEQVVEIAWTHLVARHGRPGKEDGGRCDPDFAVLAYGKQGGFELGYGSDLDLVFIHDGALHGSTDGVRPIENAAFFNRLGQRIIHILSSYTHSGVLYEIDVRLRPEGRKGLLVTSVNAFGRYQEEQAWTWEHQALVRARFVAGDAALGHRIEEIRRATLVRLRDPEKLRRDIIEMRERMRSLERSEESGSPGSRFDLKHALGAVVDIEFMVQYAVLAWSHRYPLLCEYTDNYRILGVLQEIGVFEREDVDLLRNAYLAYRSALHVEALGGQLFISAYSQLSPYREKVVTVWRKLMQNGD